MSTIDEALKANQRYAQNFKLGDLAVPPARRLTVVTCMDARLTVEEFLGLKTGDAHIIRNAGGLVTEDVIRSLLLSQYVLGTNEVMIVNHTGCGLHSFNEKEFRIRLERESGTAVVVPEHFHAFTDLAANVRRQIQKLRSHPWVSKEITVRGFIFDVKTGGLEEVTV